MGTKDDDMILISKVAKATGVPVDTIRDWARKKQIEAERRETPIGPAWFATIESVQARNAKRSNRGRPRSK